MDSWPRAADLPTGIEDLREKREEVNRSIAKDEEEKGECATSPASSIPSALCSHVPQCVLLECLLLVHAAKIQNDLRILTERLARINDNLARKITSRNEYDKTIQETEAAYSKVRTLHITSRASNLSCASAPFCLLSLGQLSCVPQIMESSQTLLHVLKRESVNLTKKKQASS